MPRKLVNMTYYRKYLEMQLPWTPGSEQTVGYYSKEETAQKIAILIREINMRELPGGIDVKYEKLVMDVKRNPKGLCVNDGEDQNSFVREAFNREELKRIADINFKSNIAVKQLLPQETKRLRIQVYPKTKFSNVLGIYPST